MKFIKQFRILLAIPLFWLANKIDARDKYDLQAEFDRLNPPIKK